MGWNLSRDNPNDASNTAQIVEGVSLQYGEHIIVDDDNGDGIINKDETVYLKVFIKNNGSSDAKDVKATISTTNSYISQLSPTTEVDYTSAFFSTDIASGDDKFGNAGTAPNFYNYTVSMKRV